MEKQMNDFTTGNIPVKLARFMLPILGALILQAMYGAVDLVVVGRFGTTAGLSAVSTGSNIVNLVVFTVSSLAMGVTVLMGRYIGEQRPERCGKVIGGAICFFAALSVVIAILMLAFARPLAILMQAPEEALQLTILYVRICGGGILFIISYNLISSIFRGLGDSRMPLIFVAIACVVNIFGDLLFVAIFHMNVVGAALATVMAQAVSVILSLVIISKRGLPFTFSVKDISFNGEIGRFIRVGFPIALQEFLTQISFLALCAFINRMGLHASSGYGVASKIVSFVMLIPSSLMQSMASFVAQNVGARKEKRARQALVTGMGIGAFIGVFVMLLVYFQGGLLAGIFTQDAEVVAQAADYLRGFSMEAILTSILFSLIGYYNGHSQTMFVMVQGLGQTFLVRLPMSYIMSIQPDANLTMIGRAAPTASAFGILLGVIYFIIFSNRMKKKQLM